MNMKKIKILMLALVFIPGLIFAQTTLDSTQQTTDDSTLDSETELRTATSDTTKTTETSNTTDTNNTTIDTSNTIEPYDSTLDNVTEDDGNLDSPTSREEDTGISDSDDTVIEPVPERTSTMEFGNEDETYNNIETITNSLNDLQEEGRIAESEIRDQIKKIIDRAILNIRSQTDIEAYELQRVVDQVRTRTYEYINQTIGDASLSNYNFFEELDRRIEEAVLDIQSSLQDRSGIEVEVEEDLVSIRNTLLRYQEAIEEKRVIINEREGDLIEKDTDNDGLSDYDEKVIYKTDPENAFTVPGELNDAQKIERGINPTDPEQKPIAYEDPREDRKSVISKIHRLKKVELVTQEGVPEKRLRLEGTALPNSFVTIYIFSTPTIVTVKTDSKGEWVYTLDKELDNGEHEVYVATVDNSGRLLARSEGIPITKTAEAATLGTFGIGEPTPAQTDFVQENFILIVLAILLFALIVVLILSGGRRKEEEDLIESDNLENQSEDNTESENKEL